MTKDMLLLPASTGSHCGSRKEVVGAMFSTPITPLRCVDSLIYRPPACGATAIPGRRRISRVPWQAPMCLLLTEAQRQLGRPLGPPLGRPGPLPGRPGTFPSRPGGQGFPGGPGIRPGGGGSFPRPGGGQSCGGHVCRPGQRCVPQQVQCFRAPCPPIYRCV
ncbi:translation initiation factor IF-2 isoform X2 [Dermacentor silvarum]|uniref:translation initiation factor IF-2 isoform X2 n=1 Tax=Dermacentor silvarum TaxID=543639 RepID=UPI0018980830|nr:translation initiation factor IF-2 isoform X2 [Dermacentor silvarum]